MYKEVTVAGSGVLGSQIAFQTALHGFQVTVYDISDEAIAKGKERVEGWQPRYAEDLGTSQESMTEALGRITYSSNLAEAVSNADLVIEAVPEVVAIKTEFYQKLGEVAPEKTVFVTNSSTLLPSQFAEATGRPEKFLALHFANEIWKNNTGEVMKHSGTDETYFNEVLEFATNIGMVALPIHKEQPGYILNSLLVPFLEAAQQLVVNGVSDPETVDKTWMIGTGAPKGPFAILDIVGLTTAYNISSGKAKAFNSEAHRKASEYLKTEYIDKGKLGIATGEGFYTYPHPNYEKEDFLK